MDPPSRVSRLPTPHLPLRRRPPISAPISQAQHNIGPFSATENSSPYSSSTKASSSIHDRLDTTVDLVATADHGGQNSATRLQSPDNKQAEKPIQRWPLPKSRTLNVFSSISHSLSRSSLIPSRRTNCSSKASASSLSVNTAVWAPPTPIGLPSALSPKVKGSRRSLGSHKSEVPFSPDPCIVYEAQSSAYWAGRFMSLHDRFQSEVLSPKSMQSLISTHSQRMQDVSQRSQQARVSNARYTRLNTRLPPSATSAAILQQTSGNMANAIANADAALLLDDDELCKRVFVHLEAFCATDEARQSLRTWQQDYARKTGRKKLQPRDGITEELNTTSLISRLIRGKKAGKRASIM
ncbi:hypothetical protein M406DRAFT_74624 [Cryphonectria parasitica EP155]|uniref:Uncharacterized protein n=1 Tax=Cryphonectria parasitica (strain ATCC 38755 / EP155) TaxID=660469 RepID=A0A9P4XUT2_CRYP1|nr:uncharacterized protein M406DRAFT_74624 [Cryphonectria parasitica EP155]KAF3761677.1 hypothetical protein M406DRAFT_74624 [Cryphonectria parasitica EP155]